MNCPGCKREIVDVPSTSVNRCKYCGYFYRAITENYLLNRILNDVEDLGQLHIGDKVKIQQEESVWNGEQGIIREKIHKYYKVQIIRGGQNTSMLINVPHQQVVKI